MDKQNKTSEKKNNHSSSSNSSNKPVTTRKSNQPTLIIPIIFIFNRKLCCNNPNLHAQLSNACVFSRTVFVPMVLTLLDVAMICRNQKRNVICDVIYISTLTQRNLWWNSIREINPGVFRGLSSLARLWVHFVLFGQDSCSVVSRLQCKANLVKLFWSLYIGYRQFLWL